MAGGDGSWDEELAMALVRVGGAHGWGLGRAIYALSWGFVAICKRIDLFALLATRTQEYAGLL